MSLPRPGATIALDGQTLKADEAGLLSVRLSLGFNSHDRAELTLWPGSRLAGASPGSELSITLSTGGDDGGGLLAAAGSLLGGGGEEDSHWTGSVESVWAGSHYVRLSGLAKTAELSGVRRSETWIEQDVGAIVQDLAEGLDSEVEADLTLPSFSIDNRRSVWSCLNDLAQLAGAELSSGGDGSLRFIRADKESSPVELRYGADLIDWRVARANVPAPRLAAEHGAASSAGGDKWHWLAHDPVGAGGDPVRVPGAFRTRDAAEGFAAAAQARQQRGALRGEVWLGGRPDLRPGSWVELQDIPERDFGSLRVRAVTHQLDGENGFITALAVEGTGAGGGLGLGL